MTKSIPKKSAKDQESSMKQQRERTPSKKMDGVTTHADLLALQDAAGNQATTAATQAGTQAALGVLHESKGQALSPAMRTEMESALGTELGAVRIHDDTAAQAANQAINAAAFTQGENIYLGASAPAVASGAYQQLLAHELVHVLQQHQTPARSGLLNRPGDVHEQAAQRTVAALQNGETGPITSPGAPPAIQRQMAPGGGATPGTGQGIDLIFIIRAEDDRFTAHVTKYIKTVLQGQTYYEVDNLDEIFDQLALRQSAGGKSAPAGQKVRRIRIVAHGSTTGGVKMTPSGETKRRWFTPDEVKQYASQPAVRATVNNVMAPGAQVEFWGCNVGNVAAAGQAWSNLFGADFMATTETFRTGFNRYYRPPAKGEKGIALPGQRGKWAPVTHTGEVDSRNQGLKNHFRAWLLQRYSEMVANGDIAPLQDKEAQLAYMRDLFNRSNGEIRHILVQKKSNKAEIRPGAQQSWAQLWQTFTINP